MMHLRCRRGLAIICTATMEVKSLSNLLVLAACWLQRLAYGQTVDLSLVQDASGQAVVEAVIYKLSASKIFPPDYNFLKRVAYVESRYGANNATTAGGIWRVPDSIYTRTKNTAGFPLLVTPINSVSTAFAINWLTTTYNDLRKPLYSGLAMSLYLVSLNMTIPQTIINQATFWNTTYNQLGTRNQTNFISDVTDRETAEGTCSGRMDLVIVCDSSGSIGSNDFNKARTFINNLIGSFDIESTRMGCMFYSTNTTVVIPLNHTLSLNEMQAAVNAFQYAGGWTFTNNAIEEAVRQYSLATARPGLPRVLALFTDGMSTEKNVSNIGLARAIGLTSFAVGIGSAINNTELIQIAYGDTGRVFKLDSYDSLNGFHRYLNSETCGIAITPRVGEVVADAVKLGERRYYKFDLSSDHDINVMLDTTNGDIVGYYSFTAENPNAALHDGVLGTRTVLRLADGDKLRSLGRSEGSLESHETQVVYVAVEGMDLVSNYTIQAVPAAGSGGPYPSWLVLILRAVGGAA